MLEQLIHSGIPIIQTLSNCKFNIVILGFQPTLTPALARSLEASSASNGAGIGTTGKSFVEIPLCCLDM